MARLLTLPLLKKCGRIGILQGGAQVLALGVAFQCQLDEAVDEFAVADAAGLPQFGVHADGGEAGKGVDLVEVEALGAALESAVDAGIDQAEAHGWWHSSELQFS